MVLLLGAGGGGGGGAQLPVGQSAGDVRLGKHLTQIPYQGVTVSQDYFCQTVFVYQQFIQTKNENIAFSKLYQIFAIIRIRNGEAQHKGKNVFAKKWFLQFVKFFFPRKASVIVPNRPPPPFSLGFSTVMSVSEQFWLVLFRGKQIHSCKRTVSCLRLL